MAAKHPPGPVGSAPRNPASPEAETATGGRRMVKSSDLLAGTNEVRIEHNGEVYLLRQTSKGKLILTK